LLTGYAHPQGLQEILGTKLDSVKFSAALSAVESAPQEAVASLEPGHFEVKLTALAAPAAPAKASLRDKLKSVLDESEAAAATGETSSAEANFKELAPVSEKELLGDRAPASENELSLFDVVHNKLNEHHELTSRTDI
jgi:hypothetical protein